MLLQPPATPGPAGLGELLVATPGGELVPVSAVATVRDSEGPAVINRESLQRRVLVEVNVRGRDLVGFVKDAQRRVAERVHLPRGVRVTWGGQFENFTRARDRLLFVVPLALGIIFGMLFLMFGDVRYAVAVFAGAPFALIGGVLALFLRGPARSPSRRPLASSRSRASRCSTASSWRARCARGCGPTPAAAIRCWAARPPCCGPC